MRLPLSIAMTVTVACGLAACKLPVMSAKGGDTIPNEVVLGRPAVARAVLTGTIVAPAGVIANNAAGLIANNGGGLIANNGGGLIGKTKSYRALGLAESPLASAEVFLATADGRPIPGLSPVHADAQGHFTFSGVPKGFAFMVVTPIKLPTGDDGRLTTLARATEAAATAKISLASTFVTAALTQGRTGTVGTFTTETFDQALKATEPTLGADDVAKAGDPAAAAAKVEAAAKADDKLQTSLTTLKKEVATATQSVDELAKAVATIASAAPTSPAPGASGSPKSPAPSASAAPSATPTAAASTAAAQGLTVSTVAGAGAGYLDAKGRAALFHNPTGIAVASDGSAFVADTDNHRIRKIAPDGTVTTFAGSGTAGFTDGVGAAASFNQPWALAIDGAGTLYVSELGNHAIRKIAPDGAVTTFVGTGTAGKANGTGTAASLNAPKGLCLHDGTLYVADTSNQRIRLVSAAGVVTTLAGSGYSYADGRGEAAAFRNPTGLAVGDDGTIYVVDGNNYAIRTVKPDGTVATLAGKPATKGLADGDGADARFEFSAAVVLAGGKLVVCDQVNNCLREVSLQGHVTTIAGDAAAGTSGITDGPAAGARFRQPRGIAIAPGGGYYVVDSLNNRVRRVK